MDEQLDVPDRADWYAMQIAAEVRRGLVKDPRRVKADDFRIRFQRQKPAPPVSPEEQLRRSKAQWFAAVGMKPPANL